jgi:hypothetical protein
MAAKERKNQPRRIESYKLKRNKRNLFVGLADIIALRGEDASQSLNGDKYNKITAKWQRAQRELLPCALCFLAVKTFVRKFTNQPF